MNTLNNTRTFKIIQLFWAYFIGIGALYGALMMFFDPTGKAFGMDSILPILQQNLSFIDFLFNNFIASGIVLLIANGLTNGLSIILIHRKSKYSALSGVICGIILILWIILEFYLWGFAALSVIFLIFGLCQILNALWWIRISSKNI